MTEPVYATLGAGAVEYDMAAAGVPISDLIEALESARDEGATHIVGLSGNYRGASYVRLSTSYDWADDEPVDY